MIGWWTVGLGIGAPEESEAEQLALEGQLLLMQGDLTGAERAFRRAVALEPDNASAYAQLGDVLEKRGDLDGALAAYYEALSLNYHEDSLLDYYEEASEAYQNVVDSLRRGGDLDGAEAACRRAIELDPDLDWPYATLGDVLRKSGDLDGAEAACRRAIELDPNMARPYATLSDVLRKRGDLDGAEAACRRAIELNPCNDRASIGLGAVLQARGDLDGAEAACRRAIALNPDEGSYYVQLSEVLVKTSDFNSAMAARLRADDAKRRAALLRQALDGLDGADAAYRRAIERDPTDGWAYVRLGALLQDRDNLAAAVVAFRRAVALLQARDDLAGVETAFRHLEAVYRREVELDPDRGRPHHELGNFLKERGDLVGALAAYHGAAARGYEDAERAYQRILDSLQKSGNLDGVAAAFQQLIEDEPNARWLHAELGDILWRQDDLDGAEAAFQRAMELNPGEEWPDAELREALEERHGYQHAERVYRRAARFFSERDDRGGAVDAFRCLVELLPDDGWLHAELGHALRWNGDLDGAEAAFRRSVALGSSIMLSDVDWDHYRHERGDVEGFVDIFIDAAHFLQERGALEVAEAAVDRILDLIGSGLEHSSHIFIHTFLGDLRRLRGDLHGAAEAYQEVVDYREWPERYDYGRDNLEDFEDAYRRLAEVQPDEARVHSQLGDFLKELGDLDGAVAAYRRVVELQPDDASAYAQLGDVLRKRGDLDDAEAAYRRVVELEPANASAYAQLGDVLSRRGDLDGAEAASRRVVELEPDDASAYAQLGDVLSRRGDLDDAEAAYRRAIELQPDEGRYHALFGQYLQEYGDFDDAEAAYERAIELEPTEGRYQALLGQYLQENGDRDGAIAAYQRASESFEQRGDLGGAADALWVATELDPESLEIKAKLGEVLAKQGDCERAKEVWESIVEDAESDYHACHFDLMCFADLLEEGGDLDGAKDYRYLSSKLWYVLGESELMDVIAEIGDDVSRLLDFGLYCLDHRDYIGAFHAYERAAELSPHDYQVYDQLVDLLTSRMGYKLQGDGYSCDAAVQKAVELNPDQEWSHRLLGEYLQDRGDQDGAEAASRRAVELNPDQDWAHHLLAEYLEEHGDLDGAEASYRRAIEVEPGKVWSYRRLGEFLQKRRDLDGAEAVYRRAVELNPDQDWAHRLLAEYLEKRGDQAGA